MYENLLGEIQKQSPKTIDQLKYLQISNVNSLPDSETLETDSSSIIIHSSSGTVIQVDHELPVSIFILSAVIGKVDQNLSSLFCNK